MSTFNFGSIPELKFGTFEFVTFEFAGFTGFIDFEARELLKSFFYIYFSLKNYKYLIAVSWPMSLSFGF